MIIALYTVHVVQYIAMYRSNYESIGAKCFHRDMWSLDKEANKQKTSNKKGRYGADIGRF